MTDAGPAGLLVLGFGGHARSVADVALSAGFDSLLFVDELARPDETFAGHPVQRHIPASLPDGWYAFPASGNNVVRHGQFVELSHRGWPIATLIAPTASIGAGAHIGRGCFIGHQSHVGPEARIAEAVIVNTGAVVEHEVRIGCCVHVSVNATVAGRSVIGEFSMIGAGATVIDKLNVAARVTVGAGACVVSDIDDEGVYVGVPARSSKRKR